MEGREQGFQIILIISRPISLTSKKKPIINSIFNQCFSSIPLENIKKVIGFLIFSGGIEVQHWFKMSL